MTDQHDFPLSPDCWADTETYYQAFKKARSILSSIPAKHRDPNEERALYELTTQLFSTNTKSDALFRTGLGGAEPTAAAWLSKVRTLAEWFTAAKEIPAFKGISKQDLEGIAPLSAHDALNEVETFLSKLGIVVIYERAIPGAKVDGATFTLPSGTPVIGLSLRYPRIDHYWFTLLHELSHVALHYDLLLAPILDDLDQVSADLVEKQADRLAEDALIPRHAWRSCPAKYTLASKDVLEFANKQGISPDIVAGRLRRELGRYELFPDIRSNINTREVIFGKD